MRWLFVTVDFPWPLIKGYCVRIYNLTRTLRLRGDDVSLLCYPGDESQRQTYSDMGVEIIPGLTGQSRKKGKSRSLLAPFVYHESIAEILSNRAKEFDIIVLVNSETLQYAPEASDAKFVIANVADDPVLEIYRRMKHLYDPLKFARYTKFIIGHLIYERAFIKYINLLTFVSPVDADSFARRHPRADVCFIPNGVDIEFYKRREYCPPENFNSPSVVFPGNMSHPPNVDAAKFLINEVAPFVWQHREDVAFVLAGCNPSECVRKLADTRVIVTGFVNDLRPLLWSADIVAIPMRIGTGIKNKLLEAWASQSAVVATPHACQGIPARAGENLLIAESPYEFATHILTLLEDMNLRNELARAGRKTVESEMMWDNTIDRLYERISVANVDKCEVGTAKLSSVPVCCAEDLI